MTAQTKQKEIASEDQLGITRRILDKLQHLIGVPPMIDDPILKDAFEFEKRLKSGQETFLTPEESARWRDSIRLREESITRELQIRLQR